MVNQPPPAGLPPVTLELRHGSARPTRHEVTGDEFLIGGVSGCDLRLPGANLPPVIALIIRQPDGVRLRKLAPNQPVLHNGQPIAQAMLHHGDCITIGPVDLIVATSDAALPEPPPPVSMPLNTPRSRRPKAPGPQPAGAVLFAPDGSSADLARRETAHAAEAKRLLQERQELTGVREELARIRQELFDRTRERQAQLTAQEETVRIAARALDDEKRRMVADAGELGPRLRDLAERGAAVESRGQELGRVADDLAHQREELEAKERNFQERTASRSQEMDARAAELAERERRLAEDREALDKGVAQHQADLIRLDRQHGTLEQKQQHHESRAEEVDRAYEQLRADTADLEEQVRHLETTEERLRTESERLAHQKADQEAAEARLAERAATIEGQQAMLAALRTRVERMREEVRAEQQQLAAARARQEAAAAELQQRLRQTEEIRGTLETEQKGTEQERKQLEERGAALQQAVVQLRQLQENLAVEDERLRLRGTELDQQAADQAEQAALLKARAEQLLDLQQRTEADRKVLREREQALQQAEDARQALQEQLRRRAEELTGRHRSQEEQSRSLDAQADDAAKLRDQIEQERQKAEQDLIAQRQELQNRAAELERLAAALAQREEALRAQLSRLEEASRDMIAERKALAEAKGRWEAEQRTAAAAAAQAHADLDRFRQATLQQAALLHDQLPDLEDRGRAAAERLAQAREQVRGHLTELHGFARQSQDDVEAVRQQVQMEIERLRQQEQALQRGRAEHRLAVSEFRQQLIEWQGRIGELKQAFAQNETRLDRRTAALDEATHEAEATSLQLTRQAEDLEHERHQTNQRRAEMERHLGELRDWYRQKLRELAGVGERPPDGGADEPDRPEVLSLLSELDPGDRQLGELLRSLGLVEADALTGLWSEARRQRRSLRQVLLASGSLTLYQLALIEAGNLDGLMVGPLRVIDRVRVTPRETVYRVADPRPGGAAGPLLLRHLAEGEMLDAVHPDEYRQRFAAAAAVRYPHLAATLEVLEIAGRPATLQESVAGLASGDWPALIATPSVWLKLVRAVTEGLHAIHAAELVHGRLTAAGVVLTAEGVVRLCGWGEPTWLAGPAAAAAEEPSIAADLSALGRLALDWSVRAPMRRSGGKTKAWPDGLQSLLRKWAAEGDGYGSTAELLDELNRAAAEVLASPEEWKRLVEFVRDNAIDGSVLRRTA